MSGLDDEAQCSNTSPSEPDDLQCADKPLRELLLEYEEKFKIGDRLTEETTARNVMVVVGGDRDNSWNRGGRQWEDRRRGYQDYGGGYRGYRDREDHRHGPRDYNSYQQRPRRDY
ncbi:hypothetical protein MRX96_017218 [Rhipicephalus microplus]